MRCAARREKKLARRRDGTLPEGHKKIFKNFLILRLQRARCVFDLKKFWSQNHAMRAVDDVHACADSRKLRAEIGVEFARAVEQVDEHQDVRGRRDARAIQIGGPFCTVRTKTVERIHQIQNVRRSAVFV